jgi:hypothetical protein
MKIDRKLNFVIPLYDEAGTVSSYVHSTPISREVFEANAITIAQTFTSIYAGGLGATAGPRIAAILLRRNAQDSVGDDSEARLMALEAINHGLFSEIYRLTNVVINGPTGWMTVPYEVAVKQNMIDEDDAAEVENALVSFIVDSAMHKKRDVAGILKISSKLWGAQTSSLNCTEFAASLQTLKEVVSIGETPEPEKLSSVPY